MTDAAAVSVYTDSSRRWSLAALGFGILAAFGDVAMFRGEDLSALNWPFLFVPAVLVPMPLAWPHRVVKIAAAFGMACWMIIGSMSVGVLFLPCVLLMIGAAFRSARA